MRKKLLLGLVCCLMSVAPAGAGELVVVVHRDSRLESLSREQVSHLFLGRLTQLPSGERARVVEVEPYRERFYRLLVNKELAEINAYWARLKFSGRTQAPLRAGSPKAALAQVAGDRATLAFVEAGDVDGHVKVVYRFEP
jgi:hypothetical protein